ncbi:MAG: lycopene cyclase domain-containing protein [Crocinitomicaceae bacterium]
MKSLYLILDIATLACPLLLSFDNNIQYAKSWKSSLLAALIIAIPFIIWDIIFTQYGFWGFNPEFITGIYIFHLPIEEILFFIIVPFACTFIYECCKYFFRSYQFIILNRVFTFFIPLYALNMVFLDDIGYYTLLSIVASSIVLFWMMRNPQYRFISIAFCFILMPFFIVNGFLTGEFTEFPVVWYNDAQKVDYRIFTIPMEDVLYNFALIVSNILAFEFIKKLLAK